MGLPVAGKIVLIEVGGIGHAILVEFQVLLNKPFQLLQHLVVIGLTRLDILERIKQSERKYFFIIEELTQENWFYLLEEFDLFGFIRELVGAGKLLQFGNDLADKG